MRNVQVFALAAVLAGSLVSIPAHASGNADVYNFLAGEKSKAKSLEIAATPAIKTQGSKILKVSKAGNTKPGKASRRKPAGDLPSRIAPAHLAAQDIEAKTRPTAGRKPLGYDAKLRERYRTLIAKHAAENGLPFALGDAVVRVESRYRQEAMNGGAVGLMQIKPSTARGLGFNGTAKGLMHPETNIKYGMKYLGQAYQMAKGDTCGTVMRYQSGHYAKRINRANLAYCANVRTIVASLGTEVAMATDQAVSSSTAID